MISRVKNNDFAKNSLVLFIGSILANALNYIFHLVVGRMVSVEIYGQVESLMSLMTIIAVPSLAITMIATKSSAEGKAEGNKKKSQEILRYLNRKIIFWGSVVFLAALALTPVIGSFLKIREYPSLVVVWLLTFVSFFLAANNGVLSGWQRFKDVSWILILGNAVKLAAVLSFILIGFRLNGIMSSFFLGTLVSYFISFYFLNMILKSRTFSSDHDKKFDSGKLKNYIWPALWGNIAISILGNVDMVMAKHNLDEFSAGQYGALTIVSKIIFFATSAIATVLFAMSAEENHKNQDSFKILTHALYLMSVVSVGAIVVYAVFPQQVLGLLFGSKYDAVSGYLGWFALLVVLFSFVNLLFQYLLSIHQTKVAKNLMLLSILAISGVYLVGNSISAILEMMITAQVLAITMSCFYLLKTKASLATNRISRPQF